MMPRYSSILALFLTVVVFASTVDVANAGNLRAAVSRDSTTKDTPTNAAVDDTNNKAKTIEAKSKSFRDEVLNNRAAVAVVSKTSDKKQKERRTAEAAKADAASDRPADRHRKVVKSRRTTTAVTPAAPKKDTATAKANQDDDRTIKDNNNKRKTIDQDRRAKIVQRRAESLHARKNRSTATTSTKPMVPKQQEEEEDEDNDVWNNILTGADTMIDSTADEDDVETTTQPNANSNNAISRAKTARRAEAFRDQVRAVMTMRESFKA